MKTKEFQDQTKDKFAVDFKEFENNFEKFKHNQIDN